MSVPEIELPSDELATVLLMPRTQAICEALAGLRPSDRATHVEVSADMISCLQVAAALHLAMYRLDRSGGAISGLAQVGYQAMLAEVRRRREATR